MGGPRLCMCGLLLVDFMLHCSTDECHFTTNSEDTLERHTNTYHRGKVLGGLFRGKLLGGLFRGKVFGGLFL